MEGTDFEGVGTALEKAGPIWTLFTERGDERENRDAKGKNGRGSGPRSYRVGFHWGKHGNLIKGTPARSKREKSKKHEQREPME